MQNERRYTADQIEVRGLEGAGAVVEGHASTFDQPYKLMGFDEQVARGAFKKTISEASIAALWNHDPNIILGRYCSASARWLAPILSLPARSAMLRASFNTRW